MISFVERWRNYILELSVFILEWPMAKVGEILVQ